MSDDYRRLPLMALDDIRCTPSALFHLPHWQPSAPPACMGCGAPMWCSDIMQRKGCRDIRAPLRPRVERKKTMAQDFGDDIGDILVRAFGRACKDAYQNRNSKHLHDEYKRIFEKNGMSKDDAAAKAEAGGGDGRDQGQSENGFHDKSLSRLNITEYRNRCADRTSCRRGTSSGRKFRRR